MANYNNPWLNSNGYRDAQAATPAAYTPPWVTPQDKGAKGDGQNDDTTALLQWAQVVQTGSTPGYVPAGIYLTTKPIVFKPVSGPISLVWATSLGARIKASASMPYVMCFDYSGGGVGYARGGHLSGIVLDGGGYAVDGLSVKGVVAGVFNDIRITNITGAGLHASLPNGGLGAQDCVFNNIVVSANYEAFQTIPSNGILLDDSGSNQANVFYNPVIEGVSGDGISFLVGDVNIIYGGTSEGNEGYGLRIAVLGTKVTALDVEVNTLGDVFLSSTSAGNSLEFMNVSSVTDNGSQNTWSNCGNSSGLVADKLLCFHSAPGYFKGGMYFDLTLNKLRVGGAAGWETVTSI